MIQCPKCSHENRQIAQFCEHCGTLLQPKERAVTDVDAPIQDTLTTDPGSLPSEEPAVDTQDRENTEREPTETTSAGENSLTDIDLPSDATSSEQASQDDLRWDEKTEADTEPIPAKVDISAAQPTEPSEEASPLPTDDADGSGDEPDQARDASVTTNELETQSSEILERAAAPPPGEETQQPESDVPVVEQEQETASESAAEPQDHPAPLKKASPVRASDQAVQEDDDESWIDQPFAQDEQEDTLVPIVPQAEQEGKEEIQELAEADLLPWREDTKSREAFELGTILVERYRVSKVLSEDADETLYRVRDLKRCPRCGYADNNPSAAFCKSCGAVLDQKPQATMLERPADRSEEPVEAAIKDHFVDQDRAYWVWYEVAQTDPLDGGKESMRITIGQKSDTGRVRELDEDSLLALTMSRTCESMENTIALFIVADGMGGHEGGEIASKVAIQTLTSELMEHVFLPELQGEHLSTSEICSRLEAGVKAANDRVFLERQKRQNDMGTTVTAAVLRNWQLYLAHVGDCRAYRWSQEGLDQLTTDHSIIASMVAAGTAAPEEIYTHPQRSVIYRCVGDQPTVEVDTSTIPIAPGDRLLLCCDGLWEMIREEGIQDVLLSEPDPQRACDLMVEQANLAGGSDNISVIIAQL